MGDQKTKKQKTKKNLFLFWISHSLSPNLFTLCASNSEIITFGRIITRERKKWILKDSIKTHPSIESFDFDKCQLIHSNRGEMFVSFFFIILNLFFWLFYNKWVSEITHKWGIERMETNYIFPVRNHFEQVCICYLRGQS